MRVSPKQHQPNWKGRWHRLQRGQRQSIRGRRADHGLVNGDYGFEVTMSEKLQITFCLLSYENTLYHRVLKISGLECSSPLGACIYSRYLLTVRLMTMVSLEARKGGTQPLTSPLCREQKAWLWPNTLQHAWGSWSQDMTPRRREKNTRRSKERAWEWRPRQRPQPWSYF